jgi:DNA-binding NarL/FixJ family response regulator
VRRLRQRSTRQKIIAMLACGCSRGEIINTLGVSPEFVRKTIFDVRAVCAKCKLNTSADADRPKAVTP